MTYFKDCKTAQEVKDLYSSLSQVLHPSLAGNTKMIAELDQQYKEALSALNGSTDKDDSRYEYSAKLEQDLMDKLQKIQGLGLPQTVSISINGMWLWVRGTVKNIAGYYPVNSRHDSQLINAGMTLQPVKGEYYYRHENCTYRGFGDGKTASDSIALRYGAR